MPRIWDFWRDGPAGGTETKAANFNAREAAIYQAAYEDAIADGRRVIQHDLQLYGPECREAEALTPDISLSGYNFPGSALSSSLVSLFSGMNAEVLYAVWDLVWTPKHASCGVRLISAEDGPSNITVLQETTPSASASPLHPTFNVTDAFVALREVLAAGVIGDSTHHRQIGHQVKVNTGVTAPVIFSSRVQILLEV